MRHLRFILIFSCFTACAEGAVEQPHPNDGSLHHPEGICVLGEQVHVVSSNHDRRYRSGALLSYRVADLLAEGDAPPLVTRNHEHADWPIGFGGVLNLAACIQPSGDRLGEMVLLDRVGRSIVRWQAQEDGTLLCSTDRCVAMPLGGADASGVKTGILDPGPAALDGSALLFSSRVDEQATLLNDSGDLSRVGEAAASRPVTGAPWLLGRQRGVALRLRDGEIESLRVEGWDGARWGVAAADPGFGFALGRFGDLLIAFVEHDGALKSLWHAPLRGQRRRLLRAGGELLAFGGIDRLLERRSAEDGHLIGVVRDLSFDEPEGAALIAEKQLLVSSFGSHSLTLVDLGSGLSRVLVGGGK
jgi:hypothetical protein